MLESSHSYCGRRLCRTGGLNPRAMFVDSRSWSNGDGCITPISLVAPADSRDTGQPVKSNLIQIIILSEGVLSAPFLPSGDQGCKGGFASPANKEAKSLALQVIHKLPRTLPAKAVGFVVDARRPGRGCPLKNNHHPNKNQSRTAVRACENRFGRQSPRRWG